jgi:hypothetical protein
VATPRVAVVVHGRRWPRRNQHHGSRSKRLRRWLRTSRWRGERSGFIDRSEHHNLSRSGLATFECVQHEIHCFRSSPAVGGWRTVLDGNPPTVEVTGLGDAPYVGSLRRIGRPESGRKLIYSGTVRSDGRGPFGYPSDRQAANRCVLFLDQQPGRRLASEVTAVLILYGTRDGQRYQRFGPRGQETSASVQRS